MKKLTLVALVAMLAFAACQNGVQEVEGDVDISGSKAEAVSAVTVTPMDANAGYILSWDAVENIGYYGIYYRITGSKVWVDYSDGYSSGQNEFTYAANGDRTANTDSDKWSIRIPRGNLDATGVKSGASIEFGVQTYDYLSRDPEALGSDITWATAVTLP